MMLEFSLLFFLIGGIRAKSSSDMVFEHFMNDVLHRYQEVYVQDHFYAVSPVPTILVQRGDF